MTSLSEHQAVEVFMPDGAPGSTWALTCEHASEDFFSPFALPRQDDFVLGTHWAFDLGARDLTLELARRLHAPAVLARFSRLLVDPNRPLTSETLFRGQAEGQTLALNDNLSDADRTVRLRSLYHPFHERVRTICSASSIDTIFAIHTFTPVYEGNARALEIGVLWNREDELGSALVEHLRACGFRTEANEPYSGKDGLIYVAESHADALGKCALELEVRQDLAVNADFRKTLIEALNAFASRSRKFTPHAPPQ